jgi:hypothetical protein
MFKLPPVSPEQLQALAGLIDAGVRATGIRGARDAADILTWLEQAAPVEPVKEEPAQ